MTLCVITYKYPGRHNNSDYSFVKQIVEAIASFGHHVVVVCPYNFLHYKRYAPTKECLQVEKGKVTILRPWYPSFGSGISLSSKLRKRALRKAFSLMPEPDAIYGHFWYSAFSGYEYAKAHNIPLFVATGESEIKFPLNDKTSAFCNYVSGVICVSSKNRDESISLGLTSLEKCIVSPNAINSQLFKVMDKTECRKELKIPVNAFVVAFVGWFIQRKGASRVAEAISITQAQTDTYSIFIGKGNDEPVCKNIVYKGPLPHEEIPKYLNAADIFVLPTLHEGCCNAIVEAMACGLPIVSSDRPFNWDVLDRSNSILVNPENVQQIADAILQLKQDDSLRQRLSDGAIRMANKLTIEQRAETILDFIKSKM
jgi:glycosyltransferase involved in cell wall biosynthesis